MLNIWALALTMQNLRQVIKFFDGQTDGRRSGSLNSLDFIWPKRDLDLGALTCQVIHLHTEEYQCTKSEVYGIEHSPVKLLENDTPTNRRTY